MPVVRVFFVVSCQFLRSGIHHYHPLASFGVSRWVHSETGSQRKESGRPCLAIIPSIRWEQMIKTADCQWISEGPLYILYIFIHLHTSLSIPLAGMVRYPTRMYCTAWVQWVHGVVAHHVLNDSVRIAYSVGSIVAAAARCADWICTEHFWRRRPQAQGVSIRTSAVPVRIRWMC